MENTVLFAILDQYADWEYAFLATALQGRIKEMESPYQVRTVSLNQAPVKSIGGFTTLPDHGLGDCPKDFAALILVGGTSWRAEETKKMLPLVQQAFSEGKVVGAICDATVFLGMNGLLDGKKHTSNALEDLMEAAQASYTGKEYYQHEQVVCDGNLITANGTAYLEFTREVLSALHAYPAAYIEDNYQFFKLGYIEMLKQMEAE